MIDPLKIAVVTGNTGFCNYYRLAYPLLSLQLHGLAEVIYVQPDDAKALGEVCVDADIIVFQYGSIAEYIIELQNFILEHKMHQLIIMEFDDDYFNIHPINRGAYFYFGRENVKGTKNKWIWKDGVDGFNIKENEERLKLVAKALIVADVITVTTPQLAEVYKEFNDNVEVLPNFINPDFMPTHNPNKSETIKIVWQGGDSHYADLKLIMPALKKVKDIYKDKICFYFWGAMFPQLYKEVKGVIIPWSEPREFFRLFSQQRFDIGLIPIEKNKFNYGKSNIKWLEYSYYNIPSIVQDNIPYVQHIVPDKTGLLFHDNKELVLQLQKLIEDPLLRTSLASNAKQVVLKDYNIQTKYYLWYETYKKHLDRKIKLVDNLK